LRLIFICLLTAGLASAQAPRIGIIDFYGLHKVPEAKVRKALAVSEGSLLPSSKGDVEERLEKVSGIVAAHLEAACCDDTGKAILYVGVEEKGAPHFNYRPPPTDDVTLPAEIVPVYVKFLGAVARAGRVGKVAEDLTHGHSLMSDPDVRDLQEQFIVFAAKYTEDLRKVLRGGKNDEQRAMAAYVIGYAPDKARVSADLQYALQDPDDTVRNNAMRSLAAFAVLQRKDPQSEIKISATWFIEMLNSLIWGDRNNAAVALVTLTDTRDESVLEQLREKSIPALAQMASWKYLPHALPAYILLGRVGGMKEEELQDAWSKGQRMAVIRKLTTAAK
jgi:hypothetical protein